MKWIRLADGAQYNPEHHVRLFRYGGRETPILVQVPLERDESLTGGWMWLTIVDSVANNDAQFWNLPGAKQWVADNLDMILKQAEARDEPYDGDPVAAAEQQMAEHKAWLERNAHR